MWVLQRKLFNIPIDKDSSLICGGIINHYNMIISVVLLQNGIQVVFIPIFGLIIEGWDYNTEGQLIIFANLASAFIIEVLLFCQFTPLIKRLISKFTQLLCKFSFLFCYPSQDCNVNSHRAFKS